MVRVGDWELRIVRSGTNEPFPEVRQQSGAGTTYAVAAPGHEFGVQIIQHPPLYYAAPSTHMVSTGCMRSCTAEAKVACRGDGRFDRA